MMESRVSLRLLVLLVSLQLSRNCAVAEGDFPVFEGRPISEAECNNLPKNNCWKGMENCRESFAKMKRVNGSVMALECYGNATDRELLETTTSISRTSPTRAVKVFYSEKSASYKLSPEAVTPIKKQIIELHVMNCKDQSSTSRIGTLPLSNLLHLYFLTCKNLIVKKTDFAPFKQIRILDFFLTSIASIEPNTFTDLPQLKSLLLEDRLAWFPPSVEDTPESQTEIVAIRKIHCDCDYAWLRNWLDANPHLLGDRDEGELYIIGNHLSKRVFRSTAFYPVDCALPTLFIEREDYQDNTDLKFAINAACK
ncbi:uncharacterized protein LOC129601352 [Paramacrobiotus metropolitanus]|uniref:uncharacterized protein LOC129601352 n=1 Tax=Paramacrobiotus metropolitanus TaxID=2943436 RepID=UPI00244602E6|nr:uncharacterized protein LOC129601352 [Paramacrobiotus metropolitanus]